MFSLAVSLGAIFAQERFGELIGTATDPSGAVLPNVSVKVTNRSTLRVVETTTSNAGDYSVRNLDPGRYPVRFEVKGFGTKEFADVALGLGKTLRLNAALSVAKSEQTVQVTEAPPLIDLTNTTMANNITSEEFDRLPKARSFQNLAVLSTSVNSGAIEARIAVSTATMRAWRIRTKSAPVPMAAVSMALRRKRSDRTLVPVVTLAGHGTSTNCCGIPRAT